MFIMFTAYIRNENICFVYMDRYMIGFQGHEINKSFEGNRMGYERWRGKCSCQVAASICAASGICHAVFGFEDHASQLDSHCTVLISHERMAIRKQTCSEWTASGPFPFPWKVVKRQLEIAAVIINISTDDAFRKESVACILGKYQLNSCHFSLCLS